ncbi:hypothetical protein ACFWVM_08420 [Nocardia fluminea]|uniref:hypothetical protein n=1 Tax=Nocardia fluminea TaxID=134984 RepID=UPI003647851D
MIDENSVDELILAEKIQLLSKASGPNWAAVSVTPSMSSSGVTTDCAPNNRTTSRCRQGNMNATSTRKRWPPLL